MIAFFSNIFGYILNAVYEIVKNYGVAIILFSILIKIILLPLSIKQQKTMIKTSKIQGKVKEIQSKYKNDPEKMNKEVMDLYKKENMSPFSGCLSSIAQILLLFAMFYLVRSPLTYMKKIDTVAIDNVKGYIKQEAGENSISQTYPEISIIKYVAKLKNGESVSIQEASKNEEKIEENNTIIENETIENTNEIEQKSEEKIALNEENIEKSYINMSFLGLDLSNIPWENIKDIKAGNIKGITVLIIPLLYVISSIVSMKITTNMNKKKSKDIIIESDNKEIKEKEELDMTAQMGKSMSLFMPIMSVSISLIAPLGLALYWLLNNILMITERIILNKILNSKEDKEDA